jgi:NTP pyrophosphatase (non-canonical NTP hydrolase)
MNFIDYQNESSRTAQMDISERERLMIAGLGLAGEAGEVADQLKKTLGHGHPFNPERLMLELGDALWYIADLASCLNVSLETIAQMNIDKLRKRYPIGFSTEASINRVDTHE